ncbi:MAG: penicillin-binding protein [Patescibacteria group bacterium]|jgi:penicillin-binding protein 1C
MPISQLKIRNTRVYGDVKDGKPERPKKPRVFSLSTLLKFGLLGVAICFIVGTGVVIWVSRDLPDPNNLKDRQVIQSTKIYDRTGEHLLYEVYQNQKRTVVELDQIAPAAVQATVAIEDKDFYNHSGVKIMSIIRAAVNNFLGRKSGGGGASTLTQQLIKNTIIGNEHSYFRKIKEAILALQLEKKYSKEEIIKLYLNDIPYGSTNYGIEAASQSYFHKSSKDLNLAESATLAALIQAPSRYLSDVNSLRNRRDLVLRLMNEQGYINEEQKKAAQEQALRIYRNNGIFDAPHFVLYVKKLLADQFGENTIDTGGLKVITTLDYDKQIMAEKIVKEQGDKYVKTAKANNAALIAIDPKTSQILTMVGSRDFNNEEIDGQFNVAVLGRRQPGSSFKPFVYTAAFEKGFTPETVLYDVKTNFDSRDGKTYTPKDYDGKERGLVTLRKALQGSLNIPAVKTMYLVGSMETIDFAKRFGYTTFTGDYGLSLVLGGAEVSPLEHTNAYATLADNGVYHAPVSILEVTDYQNNTLYKWTEDPGTEAVKPELAALISSVLSDNEARKYVFGANSTLVLGDRPVAAKTGTTQDNKDAWTMGYVPTLAVGVWVGNTKPSPMLGGGSLLAGTIWNQFMKKALASTTPERFPEPPINDATKPVLRGSDGGVTLPIDSMTGRIAVSTTPENLIVMKTFVLPHDILHYVNKDDPRGPAPTNPADDPQYEAWEQGVQEWAMRQSTSGTAISFSEPPTEYDNIQTNEFAPTLSIYNPLPSQAISSREMPVVIKVSAPRGVSEVAYMVDGTTLATINSYPFDTTLQLTNYRAGEHKLKVIVSDDQGNSTSQEVIFLLNVAPDPASFEWTDATPLSLTVAEFPRPFSVTPYRWDMIENIQVYLSTDGQNERLIYTINHNDPYADGKTFFIWKKVPSAGNYRLRGLMKDKDGRVEERTLQVIVK